MGTPDIPDKVLKTWGDKISELDAGISGPEAELRRFQSQNDEMSMHSMREQSRQHMEDIKRIWGIDKNKTYDIQKLKGILADYSDSESSAEWVRSIRDDI